MSVVSFNYIFEPAVIPGFIKCMVRSRNPPPCSFFLENHVHAYKRFPRARTRRLITSGIPKSHYPAAVPIQAIAPIFSDHPQIVALYVLVSVVLIPRRKGPEQSSFSSIER